MNEAIERRIAFERDVGFGGERRVEGTDGNFGNNIVLGGGLKGFEILDAHRISEKFNLHLFVIDIENGFNATIE